MSLHPDFFVGWAGVLPPAHRRFIRAAIAGAICLFGALGLLLAISIDDPGTGAADWGQEVTRQGIITVSPYPLLHQPDGHTLMMSGFGKSGVEIDPALNGKQVTINGFMVKRGTLDMLQSSAENVMPLALPAPLPTPEALPLGQWRLSGEICDGKCYAGVMRPGSGLAHKTCASFCILGGVPPLFVLASPMAGSSYLLIAGMADAPMPDRLRDLIGVRISLDGKVTRLGDLLIFHVDASTAKIL